MAPKKFDINDAYSTLSQEERRPMEDLLGGPSMVKLCLHKRGTFNIDAFRRRINHLIEIARSPEFRGIKQQWRIPGPPPEERRRIASRMREIDPNIAAS
jgi:hypothetical protein